MKNIFSRRLLLIFLIMVTALIIYILYFWFILYPKQKETECITRAMYGHPCAIIN